MKRLLRLLAMFIPAFALAVFAAQPVSAQDKAKDAKEMKAPKDAKDMKDAKAAKAEKGKPVTKVLHEDDKVRVTETTYKPGDESESVARAYRIVRLLKGGTLQRTYPDGKVEKYERKTGEVRAAGPDTPYKVKNIGKTDVVLYTVNIKGVK